MRPAHVLLAFACTAAVSACGDNLMVGADALTVTPSSVTIAVGDSATAVASYTLDGNTEPADDVTWTSSNPATATVAGSGATASITGVAEGSATITASGRGLTATVAVAVTGGQATLVSIEVTPTAPSIALGTTVQLTATGTFSDSTTMDVTAQATWSSDDEAVATVAGGLVDSVATGDATITATVGAVSGSTTVTVTAATLVEIQVEPSDMMIAAGFVVPYAATGLFSDSTIQDLTTQVTWASSDEATATISNDAGTEGVASAIAPGTTTISATLGAVFGTANLTVTDAALLTIEVTPTDPSVALGVDPQFTAIGTYSDTSTQDITDQVTWSSTDTAVATISTTGLAETLATGTTTITATLGAISDSSDLTVTGANLVSIAITPVNPSVPLGVDPQFTATGTYTDGTNQNITAQVLWASTDTTVATISNASGSEGSATTLATGTTTISATQGTITATTDLTVTTAELDSIDVTPDDPTVANGVDPQFTATGTYSDGSIVDITDQVVWASTDTTVATISNLAGSEGLATTLAAGTTTISATLDGVTGTSDLTVTSATLVSIVVSPNNPSVPLGVDPQFTALGNYSDGSSQDITNQVTWSSTDDTVATISNATGSQGFAETLAVGSTTITATQGAVSDTSLLTVTAAALVSIAIEPTSANLVTNDTQQFTALGTYTDATTQPLTTAVTWASSATGVVQISNATGSEGLATAVGAGTADITATQGTITSNTAVVTVASRPTVVDTAPANGAVAIAPSIGISVTFSEAMNPATLTGQTTAGACTGTMQLSNNNFATCVAFLSGTPTMANGDTIASLQPAASLGSGATYKIRVLGTAASAGGISMGTTLTQSLGFTILTGLCANGLVISQVYGGGGNSGAPYSNDFIELHNAGTTVVDLTGFAVQYASATGSAWQVTPLLGSVPPGGYYLVQEAAGATPSNPLPTPDATGIIAMSGTSGKVALTSSLTPLVGTCPTGGALLDLVGYGSTASCFEGGGPTGGLSNTTAAIRNFGGCPDGDNALNFTVLPPAPRNSATTPYVCECTANETDDATELDFCNLQFPASISLVTGGTVDVFARVFEAGVTEAAGADPSITAQIGVGPTSVNPAGNTGWLWGSAAFNVQVGNDDEYVRTLTAAAPGTYSYTSRFSRDGVNWTYCDLDGAGANAGLAFDALNLGVMTVSP